MAGLPGGALCSYGILPGVSVRAGGGQRGEGGKRCLIINCAGALLHAPAADLLQLSSPTNSSIRLRVFTFSSVRLSRFFL